ncbi:hypothetical protein HOY80DRAFT_1004094 [Tuber brumale]|nr:hypothetical protein HOY80DRAFT_1004094 [Tuber brumale]
MMKFKLFKVVAVMFDRISSLKHFFFNFQFIILTNLLLYTSYNPSISCVLSTSIRPIQRSVDLYFYHQGLKVGFFGSPTLIEFIQTKTKTIPNWQHYLKNHVFQHPAWLEYPNIITFELHYRLPICVGFWDGTTTGIAPNVNLLLGSSILADLLRLTDNPKATMGTQTQFKDSDDDDENHSPIYIKLELASDTKMPALVEQDDTNSTQSGSATQEGVPPPASFLSTLDPSLIQSSESQSSKDLEYPMTPKCTSNI